MTSENHSSKIILLILVLYVSFTVQSNAESPLDDLGPCVKEEKDFKEQQNKLLAAYDASILEIQKMPMPQEEYKKIWNKVAYESAKEQVIESYSGVTFYGEQLGKMGQNQVDLYIKTVGDDAVQKEMLIYFQEHKKQALEDLAKERSDTVAELDVQKKALDDACGSGEGEKILRIAITRVANRISSMDPESTFDAKAFKFSTGISLADIKKYGLVGGLNSEARKVVKGIENIVAANIEAAKLERMLKNVD